MLRQAFATFCQSNAPRTLTHLPPLRFSSPPSLLLPHVPKVTPSASLAFTHAETPGLAALVMPHHPAPKYSPTDFPSSASLAFTSVPVKSCNWASAGKRRTAGGAGGVGVAVAVLLFLLLLVVVLLVLESGGRTASATVEAPGRAGSVGPAAKEWTSCGVEGGGWVEKNNECVLSCQRRRGRTRTIGRRWC